MTTKCEAQELVSPHHWVLTLVQHLSPIVHDPICGSDRLRVKGQLSCTELSGVGATSVGGIVIITQGGELGETLNVGNHRLELRGWDTQIHKIGILQ